MMLKKVLVFPGYTERADERKLAVLEVTPRLAALRSRHKDIDLVRGHMLRTAIRVDTKRERARERVQSRLCSAVLLSPSRASAH